MEDQSREPDEPAYAAPAPEPERIAGYRDLTRIGRGGFSVVYRAVQEAFDRPVAVKVLTVASDDDARHRFLREVRLTGRLSGHPNIVTILDAGTTAADRPYLATELYERGSLRDRLGSGGPLPAAEVAAVGAKIADALAAAHEAGIVHRDVKPNNILVNRYGEPALADFGVACVLDSLASETVLNVFSPHHAAPEVVNRGVPDAASDIYALGSTMYQLATGRPPFGRGGEEMAALLWQIVHEPAPPLDCPDLPGLAAVVSRTLSKDPDARHPSAAALAEDLRALLPTAGAAPAASYTPPVGPRIEILGLENSVPTHPTSTYSTAGSGLSEETVDTGPTSFNTMRTLPPGYRPPGLPDPEHSAYPDPARIPPPPAGPFAAAPAEPSPRRVPRAGIAAGAAAAVLALAAVLIWAPWSSGGGNGAAAAGVTNSGGSSAPAVQIAGESGSQPAMQSPSGTPSASHRTKVAKSASASPHPTATTASASASGSASASASASATASTSCFGWATIDPNTQITAAIAGADHLYVGPYSACAFVQQSPFTIGTKIQVHCFVVNSFGNEWVYANIVGGTVKGWITTSKITGLAGGTLAKC
jgi:serine/threonine protein kinase